MTAGVGIVGRQGRAGIAVDDDGGECRVVAFARFMRAHMMGRLTVAIAARMSAVACENDRGGDRDQPEDAHSQAARGSQGCTKHKLPRPNFCLDHRFVRPNYAQWSATFPGLSPPIRAGISAPIAVRAAILANRLYTNIFRLLVQRPDKSENQVRCAGFPKD